MPPNAAANRYELKELLGEGGMGVVYRALDRRTNSYVALKTLRDATDPATLDMFKREWEELGKLVHPNIVDIRDVDEIEENGIRKPCFIMPLLPGCTLASLIKSSSPRLTTDFVVSVISQVCKGLQAAHEKDLIHRDLKPSNIFIMEDDTAKIIDFGLVHAVGNKSVTGLKGTWQYMAPEQIDGSKQPNRSFDIFALGVVAYEALTGHQPFKRAKFEDTVEAVRHFVPQAISERNPKVSQLVSKAVHVAMAKQPIHRYATAREFAETLQKAQQEQYIERFDPAKIRPRIDRAKRAFNGGDSDFASEILTELEAEGNLDTDISLLRSQIDEYNKQKRVRQLFEAAQTRLEQEEIPLALEKLQEILKIDPQNQEALTLRKRIEQQRSQQQVSEWLGLARKHLDRHDFSEARRALKEVFNLKYDDPEAAHLKALIDAREKEVEAARAEKEHLYSYALRHNQNGEISSALSKLEKLLELSRNTPGASVPERDKVFQAFYNTVRTERDRIDNAYTEGTLNLSEKNFEKALQICDGILSSYPQNPQFQALRLKVEHSQRQELSAYIAEVGRAVDTEPNLDRRVGLLEEACKRYPTEGQFSRQLSLARELRDLVESIKTRARNYEEHAQFAEAITQWNTLANIHPQYPGIDFEINQLERRREQQAEEDKKARLVEKIDRALGNSAYAEAERLSQEGLVEFPQNSELLALLRMSRQGLEKTHEANRLFEEAKVQRSAGDWENAVVLLRQARDLDKSNVAILNTLVNLLIERAHALLDTDPAAAEPLAAEASTLDPEHPPVRKVIALIAEAKKKHFVEHTVLQARELQTADRDQAISILKQGLSVYPGEVRLQQTLRNFEQALGASAIGIAPEEKTVVYPNDQTERSPIVAPPPPAFRPVPKSPAAPAAVAPLPLLSTTAPAGKSFLAQLGAKAAPVTDKIKEILGGESRNLIGVVLGLLASAVVLGLAYLYINRGADKPTAPVSKVMLSVPIHVTPSDATVTVDDRPVSNMTEPFEKGSLHHIFVTRPGYQPIENPKLEVTGRAWDFSLNPEPLHLSVAVSESSGIVIFDEQPVGNLDAGSWSKTYTPKSSEEQHVLTVKNKKGAALFTVKYDLIAGKPPAVSPLNTKDLLVTSTFDKSAIVYSANPSLKLVLPDQSRRAVSAAGLLFTLESNADGYSLANGKSLEPLPLEVNRWPTLTISLNASADLNRVNVTASPNNAKLFVDGDHTPMTPKSPGFWSWLAASGSYKAKLTAERMEDKSFILTVKKGSALSRHFDLKPTAKSPARTPVIVGPSAAFLTIRGGTPGATVSLDDNPIGELDSKGEMIHKSVVPGTHDIKLSKPDYASVSSKNTLTTGKEFILGGDKTLKILSSFVRLSVSPAAAKVFLKGPADSERHQISDFSKVLTVRPGAYQFSAEAEKYVGETKDVTVRADETAQVSFDLHKPDDPGEKPFVDKNDVVIKNGNWRHGRANGYIHILTEYQTNTIFFDKGFNPKKMSWMVKLDDDNKVTYTLDSKGALVINQVIDGADHKQTLRGNDFTGSERKTTYAIRIRQDPNGVLILKQNGISVSPFRDSNEKHNWAHAPLFVKGDADFTVWTGQ